MGFGKIMVKLWQCSQCRELFEDCRLQCQLIADDDIIPTECIRKEYKFEGKWYTDDTYEHEIKDPQPQILADVAKWIRIQKCDLVGLS